MTKLESTIAELEQSRQTICALVIEMSKLRRALKAERLEHANTKALERLRAKLAALDEAEQ